MFIFDIKLYWCHVHTTHKADRALVDRNTDHSLFLTGGFSVHIYQLPV